MRLAVHWQPLSQAVAGEFLTYVFESPFPEKRVGEERVG